MAKEPPKVFIGYASEDKIAAIKLYDDLTSAGVDAWIDEKSLIGGQKWRPAIEQAIRDSRYFLSVISKNSVAKKGFVQKELHNALDILDEFPESDIFIIPVRLDDSEPSQEKLRSLHRVDMFPDWQEGLGKILKSINIYPKEPTKNIPIMIDEKKEGKPDDIDLKILKAIQLKSSTSFVRVILLVREIGIDEEELGDRFELLAKNGYIEVAGLGGSTAPGMTLPNGIHNVALTAQGRHLLRGASPASMEDIDTKILKAIASLRVSFPNADTINKQLGIDPGLLGDRLDIMEKTKGYVKTQSGSYMPGVSLPNGIYAAGLTAEGRTFLRGRQ